MRKESTLRINQFCNRKPFNFKLRIHSPSIMGWLQLSVTPAGGYRTWLRAAKTVFKKHHDSGAAFVV
jgi:hypothetical protein